jgi:uncharacterized protein (DUF1684 family)
MISQIYVDNINSWHARRISSLKNDYGWLTVVRLEWLKDGLNNVPEFGEITLQRGKVNVQLDSGLSGLIGEKSFTSGAIRSEADAKGPDKVKVGSKAFVVLKRGSRFALRIWDTNAEARKRFSRIDRFPVSEKWKIAAAWEQYKKPKIVKLPTAIPRYTEEYKVPGVALLNVGGNVVRLEPIVEEGSNELFFIVQDGTSGRETFADGRYLYAPPAAKGSVELDFNKAINPPSAFTRYATSPLTPETNKLSVRIEAGEKAYAGE